MFEKYDPTIKHIKMVADKQGFVRVLSHVGKYVTAKKGRDPRSAARDYLQDYGDLLGLRRQHLKNLLHPIEDGLTTAGTEYRFADKKSQFDLTTVAFHQTRFGLPVWEAGISVTVKHGRAKQQALRVVGARSTLHHDLRMRRPTAMSIARLKAIDAKTLAKSLGLHDRDPSDALPLHIDNSKRLIIYRYDEKARRRHMAAQRPPHRLASSSGAPGLPLPPVNRMLRDGQYYVAAAVYFSFGVPPSPPLHWVALVEAETLSVLLLRPLVADVSGWVFHTDPVTLAGGPTANAGSRSLNRLRRPVKLAGLKAPANGMQALSGRYVAVSAVISPNVAAPTRPAGRNFKFDARSNDFAAVNAYYNCDRVFRLVEDLGFSVPSYFRGTTFPTPVDHRGHYKGPPTGIQINAHCAGTADGSGIEYTCFALADLDDVEKPIGIACDWRTVLHELLGHGILYNHISQPLLKFSHSAGDSFAAILNDLDSKAPDRGDTFPWIVGIFLDQRRRHDRAASSGWGWGGEIALHPFDDAKDPIGYNNEQILSSTMFRFYRSIGGDAADITMKRFAANMVCHIMLVAIQTLTPATNPPDAAHFASALIGADLADWSREGVTGGAYRKVIRWAFEKQGLYQPQDAALPNNNPGAPPPVDIYLEDGRRGEYQYQVNYDDCRVIWNRHRKDHGAIHEEPIAGVPNYAYVKIKNRGLQKATEVVVRAFYSRKSTGLIYPNSWRPMRPTQGRSAADVPPHSADEIVVGPFTWVPRRQGDAAILMVASAAGDPSNIDHFTGRDSIPNWRLVPHDNNIGQRNVRVVKKPAGRARRRRG